MTDATPPNAAALDNPGSPSKTTTGRAAVFALYAALGVAVLAVYSQTWGKEFDFVVVGDHTYVTANAHVQSGLGAEGIRWAFTVNPGYPWHPVTWLSLQLDAHFFGPTAQGFHRTNVLLHLANTLLLFWLLRRLTGAVWRSAAVAALFAVHPLHVESVAWVTDRKDVLSTLFWLLTMAAYARYAERPSLRRYLLFLVPFALGLMSKPTLVMLPATLVLLDYWPLERWRPDGSAAQRFAPAGLGRLVVEKLPLLAMTAPVIWLALQDPAASVPPSAQYSLAVRIANSLICYVKYLGMTVWPANLANYYPYPGPNIVWWQPAAAGVLLAALTAALLWAGRKHRYLAVGWLWYLATLAPVIGLIHAGDQALADRYTYVPLLGLYILFVWGLGALCPPGSGRASGVTVLVGTALAGLLAVAWLQVRHWRTPEMLWRRDIAATGGNAVAYDKLGLILAEDDRLNEAAECLEKSIQLAPGLAATHDNLARVFQRQHRLDQAAQQLEEAVQIEPTSAPRHVNLARIRRRQGLSTEVARHYAAALETDPDLAEARRGLAAAIEGKMDFSQAKEQLGLLLRAKPDSAPLHYELANVLRRHDELTDAVEAYDRALRLWPEYPEACNGKGMALERLDRLADAVACYERAAEFKPDQLEYHLNLAYALYASGRKDAAAEEYRQSLRLSKDWPASVLAEAWTLATSPDVQRRNGARALRLAKLACQATDYQQVRGLEVLAAAHAEVGQFDDAVQWQRKMLALLPSDSAPKTVETAKDRLGLYEHRLPYREPAK